MVFTKISFIKKFLLDLAKHLLNLFLLSQLNSFFFGSNHVLSLLLHFLPFPQGLFRPTRGGREEKRWRNGSRKENVSMEEEEEEEQKRVRVAFITDMGRKEEGRRREWITGFSRPYSRC